MKKLLKRTLAILLVVSAVGATLVGCGSTSKTDTETNKSEDKQEVTVIKASTGGMPAPYIEVDDDGNLSGYDIAVFEEIVSRLPQYELEWTVTKDSLTGVLSGQYDVSVNNWAYRPERAESYYYSFPYKLTDKVFIQRIDDEPLTNLSDVSKRGYNIEVSAAGAVTSALETWNEENPDEKVTLNYSDANFLTQLQHIVDGVADYGLWDSPIAYKYIKEFGFEDKIAVYELTDETLSTVLPSVYTYFLFTKDEEGAKLRADIDAVIKELYEDGTLAKLSQEYFNSDVTPAETEFEKELN